MMELLHYNLEPLRQDGEFILYRGLRQSQTGESLSSTLALSPVMERPAPGSLRKIEHEFSLKEELDPAWAVRPLALTQDQGRTMLLLEDPGGEPLDQLLKEPMELLQLLRIAVGLAAALNQLHRRGLIHKDLKPSNVLVNAATGQVWLMGFAIALRLPRERQPLEPPELIAGTLAYMAPEQTGRMNRSIDSRTDLYALGVTLYEMLTGVLPFTAADPMEVVHCHIARPPVPPAERGRGIPAAVSAIIMKLLAKAAEERYQTAAGLERDVRRCLAQWEAERRIDDFPLAKHDTPDRLLIPEKLYGREREVQSLLTAFERVVTSGTPELVLVSGYSGIGKSSVVNELHKVLVPPRGLFASGKFDQNKRDIPYTTLAQAFQSLVRALLGKSDAELAAWRDVLREALGPNGQLMVDFVPELKLIIGDQPPVPELSPQDAQRRFQLVFRRFISVFAQPEHPLVLFLDDLHWLDTATLDLLEDLLTRADLHHLLLIGAYRDNEVDAAHPLRRKLDAICQAGALVEEISLAPLAREDVAQLIADALRSEPARPAPLAQLVHEKTAGNPFFLIQFLYALAEEGLLVFDHEKARWSWDLKSIHAKGYTDNVVELMVGKLNRLRLETQKALQQLACLGNNAQIAMLSIVLGTSEEQVHADLWEAVRLELIERLSGSYKFAHDRVQEAAYSLIPVESRAEMHLRIGRLLAAHTPPEKREETIFEIVNQLNRGAALITEQEERDQLAELNLIAGKRAKASTAYASALKYLTAGAALMPENSWERRHHLVFEVELQRAECEFLTGAQVTAEERLNVLSTRVATTIERASVACLRADLYTTMGQSSRAIAAGLDYLRHLGVEWSPCPTDEDVRREYERIWSQLGSRTIEDLIDLPLMTDPASLATMDVLTKIGPPAFLTDANLHALAICYAVNLSLERGNSDGSCDAYVRLGLIVGDLFGDYKAGFRLGEVGCKVVERRGLKRFQARAYMLFAAHLMPCTRHLRAGRELLRRSSEIANESGDLSSAGYSCVDLIENLLAGGESLIEVQAEAEHALDFAEKSQFGLIVDIITSQLGLVRMLRGLTRNFGSFDDEHFDERREDHFASAAEGWYQNPRLQAHFHVGDYASAVNIATSLEQLPAKFRLPADCYFYCALSHAAFCDSARAAERQRHLDTLAAHHKQIQVWAANCPENFENHAALVGAEIARLEGRELDAMRLYENAIQSAHSNNFVHNEALANELAGRFYAARGFEQVARVYLQNARHCYLSWGANGKVRQLDELDPRLAIPKGPAPTTTSGSAVQQLDVATIVGASQALSSEILLPRLIETLMKFALQNAGADRGLLILPRADAYRIEAEAQARGDKVEVVLRHAPIEGATSPEALLRYVLRSRKSVILDDASRPNLFSEDDYLRCRPPRSLLCLPLLRQGKLAGLLYLENTLTSHAFTPDRTAVLELLAAQAAISLENAGLYTDLQQENSERKRAEEALRRSEAYLAKAQRLSHTGSYGWNISTGEVYWSEETYRIYGYDRAIKPTLELALARTHPEDRAFIQQTVERLQQKIEDSEVQYRVLMPDGSVKHIHSVAHPLQHESGDIEYVGVVMDVTERKRAEEERERLRQVQADLAHLSRVTTMGELTASLAHEIKQPISAAVTNAKTCLRWLGRDDPDLAEAREAASRLVKDVTRATDIIGRISLLFKKGALQRELVDVNELIREMIVLLRSEANRYSISVRTELAEDLPKVVADRVQLQQVFMNLMLNGIDAMKETTGGGELTIKLEAGDGQLLISVSDTGVGLPPEQADQIFTAFFTTKDKGTGMGLPISRSIVESHGGRLWAVGASGRGATFQFTLPVTVAAHS